MLTLNAQQSGILDSDNKTDISWLFEIDRTGDGQVDDYWSTKAKSFEGQTYSFKVTDFSQLNLERGRSEYGTQTQSSFNFTLTNAGSTLLPSNFANGNVTVKWVVKSWIRKITVTVVSGPIPISGMTMTGLSSGAIATLVSSPDSWSGAVTCYFSSQNLHSFQSETVTFGNGATGTVAGNTTWTEEEALVASWNFDIISVAPKYQTLYFSCRDWLVKYLDGSYPNTPLIDDLWPSDKPSGSACVPLVFGTPYIPLASAFITNDRFYVLGPASQNYTITMSRSPMEISTKTEWDNDGSYSFNQSNKTGSDGVSYRVFQLMGTVTIEEVSANVIYQGLHGIFGGSVGMESRQISVNIGNSNTILALPTKYSRNDTVDYVSPLDVINYILQGYGVPVSRIDLTTLLSAKSTVDGWGLTWAVGLWERHDRKSLLSKLLQNCHLELIIRDKIYFKVHVKESKKTITSSLIVDNSFDYRWSRTTGLQDSGFVLFPDPAGGIPISNPIKKEIPAKSTTAVNSQIVIDCSFISSGSVHAQKLGSLALQRALLPTADVTFKAKAKVLALEPDDVITVSGANYGGDYDVLIDSISIDKNLESVQISATAFSDSLDDFNDLTPTAVTVSTDTTANMFAPVVAGPSSDIAATGSIQNGAVTGSKLIEVSASDVLRLSSGGVETVTSTDPTVVKAFTVGRSGCWRTSFTLANDGGAGTVYGQICRNGDPVGTLQVATVTYPSYDTFTEDICGWAGGDELEVKIWSDGPITGYTSNASLYCDETLFGSVLTVASPSESPSASPSNSPSISPSISPSASPSNSPSTSPSASPSATLLTITGCIEDGQIGKDCSLGTWASAHDADGGCATYTDRTSVKNNIGCWHSGLNYAVERGFYEFSLSALPGGSIVSSAVLTLKNTTNTGYGPTDYCIEKGTQGNPLTDADFAAFTGDLFSDPYTWTANGTHNISLNAAGLLQIESAAGGTLKLCVREYTHDYLNVAPGDGTNNYAWFRTTEDTTSGNRPKLVITYT